MSSDCSLPEPIDPRAKRTRKLLQDAMRELIHEKPFSSISVAEITARATVNRATFYAHFVGKEALAESILAADLHHALIRNSVTKPPMNHGSLTEFAVGVFDFLGQMHGHCPKNAAELQDTVGTTLQKTLHEMIGGWLAGNNHYRRLFPGCSRETVATVLSWSIYGAAQEWARLAPTKRPPALQACREMVSILLPDADHPAAGVSLK